jgi:predicted SnoaL-like aldol condensation-catalyzing enzyme
MSEENKAIVRRFYDELFSEGNLSVADEIFAPRVPGHAMWVNPVDMVTAAPVAGPMEDTPEDIKESVAVWRENVTGLRVVADEMLAVEDRVVALYTMAGAHWTGRPLMIRGIDIYRIAGGKIVEYWQSWDRLGMYQQVGAVPGTPDLLPKIRIDLAKQS